MIGEGFEKGEVFVQKDIYTEYCGHNGTIRNIMPAMIKGANVLLLG